MTFYVEIETDRENDIDYDKYFKLIAEEAMNLEKCPYEAEVNLIITDNEGIREINKEQRDIDAPTDVLSFPFLEYETPGDFTFLENEKKEQMDYFNPETGELMLGDIVISIEKVEEQADKYGHSMVREFSFLLAHSMLHLFGYDHIESKDSACMEQKQELILQNLGIKR